MIKQVVCSMFLYDDHLQFIFVFFCCFLSNAIFFFFLRTSFDQTAHRLSKAQNKSIVVQ